ncbi:uncharacterized protein N7459_009043 [Penicillium hispanicum]|uniref:uncharacterized protein n=1 Tax=Penicillium hispanicum TaxID=1080232 RepID=UPI0025412DE4|nr:uncharacterized protein N7459_009043 [Penicillium hispanicum]KAJ5569613.1 hypothetical protein N7459_009043 [Penicillium hispanicum]
MSLASLAQSLASFLRTLRLPASQQDRLSPALGTAACLGTATFLLPAVYRDYITFRDYGPGGLPNNLVGWLTVRMLFQPFAREMLSTEEYVKRIDGAEGHGRGDDGYLTLSPEQLASRAAAGRPLVGPHVVPQRQLTQIPEDGIKQILPPSGMQRQTWPSANPSPQKLHATFQSFGLRNHHLVKFERSNLEKHADGLFLADHLPATDLAQQMHGEVAHLHSGNDFSAHVVLAPADCKKVIEAGWGQRHGFSGTSAMTFLSFGTLPDIPTEYILIYAPRTEEEIQTVMQIVSASVQFMTGCEDVR